MQRIYTVSGSSSHIMTRVRTSNEFGIFAMSLDTTTTVSMRRESSGSIEHCPIERLKATYRSQKVCHTKKDNIDGSCAQSPKERHIGFVPLDTTHQNIPIVISNDDHSCRKKTGLDRYLR